MKIAIGCDHVGFPLKSTIVEAARALGHEVTDHGCCDETPVDFPDISLDVCTAVVSGEAERAILVCGSGVGPVIAANKMPGIRAAVCHDGYTAHQCVEHDDVNVMCVGARIVGIWLAVDLVRAFLAAKFNTDEDSRRRVHKLMEMERRFNRAAT